MDEIQNTLKPKQKELAVSEVSDLKKIVTSLIKKRLSKPTIRSYFTYNIYKYMAHSALDNNLPFRKLSRKNAKIDLPFIVEAAMTVMYLHNQVFDKKKNIKDCDDVSNNILGSNLLKDRIYDYIDEHFDDKGAPIIQKYVRKMFRSVDIGQHFDKNKSFQAFIKGEEEPLSKYEKIAALMRPDIINIISDEVEKDHSLEKKVLRFYLERNYLISSSLFKLTSEMLMKLTRYRGPEAENIFSFSESYGLLMQLVNDTSDFVYEEGTGSKNSEDVSSDVKNNIITLPLLLHLKNGNKTGRVFRFFKTKDISLIQGKHNEILKEMVISRALPDSIAIGITLAGYAKTSLNKKNPIYSDLENLLSIAYINKYYYHIFKAKRFYKKAENANKIYRCETKQSKDKPIHNTVVEEKRPKFDDSFYYRMELNSSHILKKKEDLIVV